MPESAFADSPPGDRAAGAMGWAVEIPADGADVFTLACDECGRVQAFPAQFMGDRFRQLGRARREGWGWRRDGRLVEYACGLGPRRRVARLCPVCAAIERHAAEGGLWAHLLAELRRFRAGLTGQASGLAPQDQSEAENDAPVVAASHAGCAGQSPAFPIRPSGQFDLFGHAL